MRRLLIACLPVLLMTGCLMGPDYTRPNVDLPDGWRVDDSSNASANTAWWERFQDPQLDELIRTALQQNEDLRVAAERVEEFSSALQQSQSQEYPQFGYDISGQRERLSQNRAPPVITEPLNNEFELGANASWELDIWGRIRRSNEAALAELLAVKQNQRAVIVSLVAQVATSYVQLLSYDEELKISRQTLADRAQALQLSEDKFNGGIISRLELAQTRALYEETAAAVPMQEKQIASLENGLSVLLGHNPGPIRRGRTLDSLTMPQIPQGLPSDILKQRPDVRQAEEELIAANARIGVAKTEYFPTISLTSLFGYESTDLGTLIHGPSEMGSFAAAEITGPIFNAGKTSAEVERAEAIEKGAEASYLRTIQSAFQDVDDALVTHQKTGEQLSALSREVDALQDYANLAQERYDDGYSSYIEVLYAQRSLYTAEINQTESRRDLYLSLIDTYKAMGGGWPINGPMSGPSPQPGKTDKPADKPAAAPKQAALQK